MNTQTIQDLESQLRGRDSEILRLRTTMHGAAHELDNIAVESGLGHSPKPGAVAEYVRKLRKELQDLKNQPKIAPVPSEAPPHNARVTEGTRRIIHPWHRRDMYLEW